MRVRAALLGFALCAGLLMPAAAGQTASPTHVRKAKYTKTHKAHKTAKPKYHNGKASKPKKYKAPKSKAKKAKGVKVQPATTAR